MINFPCRCGHRFSVADDQAGASIQCPTCGLLVDVPSASDAGKIETDGTYRVEPLALADEPERILELQRTYRPGRHDPEGNEIDLRNTPEQVRAAGAEEAPLELKDELRPGAPKYDPETGELIRPMAVAPTVQPPPQPAIVLGRPVLKYRVGDVSEPYGAGRILLRLFMPGNIAVVFVLVFIHLLFHALLVPVLGGLFFFVPALAPIVMLIFAHYPNVIDETGPAGIDELPTPLRRVGLREDIWDPFVSWLGALMLCYLPAFLVGQTGGWSRAATMAAGILAIPGTFLLPAVMLTQTTSGASINLRPDRLAGVIRACGARYLLAVLAWVAAAAPYSVVLIDLAMKSDALLASPGAGRSLMPTAVSLPMLFVSVYLMHFFCWYLGTLYRLHHPEFPWELQHHVRTRREQDAAAQAQAAAMEARRS